jgi:hypothetical protein
LLSTNGVSVRFDYLVERPLHVQHHGVQRTPTFDPWNLARVVVEFGQAHRLRQAPRRVDR